MPPRRYGIIPVVAAAPHGGFMARWASEKTERKYPTIGQFHQAYWRHLQSACHNGSQIESAVCLTARCLSCGLTYVYLKEDANNDRAKSGC